MARGEKSIQPEEIASRTEGSSRRGERKRIAVQLRKRDKPLTAGKGGEKEKTFRQKTLVPSHDRKPQKYCRAQKEEREGKKEGEKKPIVSSSGKKKTRSVRKSREKGGRTVEGHDPWKEKKKKKGTKSKPMAFQVGCSNQGPLKGGPGGKTIKPWLLMEEKGKKGKSLLNHMAVGIDKTKTTAEEKEKREGKRERN